MYLARVSKLHISAENRKQCSASDTFEPTKNSGFDACSGLFHFSEAGTSTQPKVIRCPIKCILQDQQTNSNITQTHTFQNRKNYKETKQKMKVILNETLMGAHKHEILFCLLNTDRVRTLVIDCKKYLRVQLLNFVSP